MCYVHLDLQIKRCLARLKQTWNATTLTKGWTYILLFHGCTFKSEERKYMVINVKRSWWSYLPNQLMNIHAAHLISKGCLHWESWKSFPWGNRAARARLLPREFLQWLCLTTKWENFSVSLRLSSLTAPHVLAIFQVCMQQLGNRHGLEGRTVWIKALIGRGKPTGAESPTQAVSWEAWWGGKHVAQLTLAFHYYSQQQQPRLREAACCTSDTWMCWDTKSHSPSKSHGAWLKGDGSQVVIKTCT